MSETVQQNSGLLSLLQSMLQLFAKMATALTTMASGGAVYTAGSLRAVTLAASSAPVAYGAQVAGSALTPSDASGTASGTVLTGTWQALGTISAAGQVTLFQRVS